MRSPRQVATYTFSIARDGSFGIRHRKARGEHNESGVPQKAEVVGTLRHFRVGPSVDIAQSFCPSSPLGIDDEIARNRHRITLG